MAERSFAREVEDLRLGEGQEFRGEGILAITKALSRELAADNILVNTVCIGLIKSGQHDRRAEKMGANLDEHYRKMGKDVPLGRVGEADEAGNVIVFLCSPRSVSITRGLPTTVTR